jgi:DNA/RNA-binding domain of Phe-tRNA-synthetase-like protein
MHLPSIMFETGAAGMAITMVHLHKMKLGKSSPDFEEYEQALFKEIRSRNKLEDLSTDSLLQSYRAMHWTYGMDPTKKRVSSEAVLRRILQGENLWRVSDLVDAINLASAFHKIPIGLIDVSKIKGNLAVRAAKKGEVFQRIGGQEIKCRGREIVLSDDIGIICYGFAIHDSERTKIGLASRNALVLHYGSSVVSEKILMEATNFTLEMVRRWIDCIASDPIRYISSH